MSRIFNVYNSGLWGDYNITLDDKTPLFHINMSTFRPGKPELTFHAGGNRNGAVVGVSNFKLLSSRSTLGVGDPANSPNNVIWEELAKESFDHSKYRFEMTIDRERRGFLWTRTHSVGVQGSKPSKFTDSNFKFTDEQTGEVIGAFATNSPMKSIKKLGKIQLDRDYGKDFEIMFFLSILSIQERLRRRRNGSGGGGGGGG